MTHHDDARHGQVGRPAAEIYEEFFVPALFGQWPPRVLEIAGFGPGDDLLDVGCGTGIVARSAARMLGCGSIHGIDPNAGMLEVARRRADTVTWQVGYAEALPFPDARFDRVVSQFAAMFYVDPGVAVSEMTRVCRAGGTVTVATWAAADESPGYARMIDLIDRLFGSACADALRAPFGLGSPTTVRDLIEPHLTDVSVEQLAGTARFASIDDWVHTDVRGWTLAALIDDDQFELLRAAAAAELADLADSNGRVSFPAPAIVGTGGPRRS